MFAGGDLDGDLYFVCWGKDMLPMKEDFAPMNYKAPKKKEESDTINLDHMTEFISEYIKRDQLGKLCTSIQKPILISSPNEKHAIPSNAIYLWLVLDAFKTTFRTTNIRLCAFIYLWFRTHPKAIYFWLQSHSQNH